MTDPNAPNNKLPKPTGPTSLVALARKRRAEAGGSSHPFAGRRKRLNAIMKREGEETKHG